MPEPSDAAPAPVPPTSATSGRRRWWVLLVVAGLALGAVLGGVFGSLARGASLEPQVAIARAERDAAVQQELTTLEECLAIIESLAIAVGQLDSGLDAAQNGDATTASSLRQQANDTVAEIDLTTCQVPIP